MTLQFGLNINRNLTDISDNIAALSNLNLDIKDLNVINKVTDPGGVSRTDFRSLAGLTIDFEKSVLSLQSETSTYNKLTTNFYDENSYIDANLTVNGQLGATAIKYLYVDYTTNTIKTAEISTSRISSWSCFESPQTDASPIFYGGEVICQGPVELSLLEINSEVVLRRFEAEVPTHKIKTTIAGQTAYLYAMKGIPLTFRGFFRNANLTASISPYISGGSTLRPSWVIKNTSNNYEYIYKNILSDVSSSISFKDTDAAERDIQFYYPVNNITALTLSSIGLTELPSVTLPNLSTLLIQGNDIREFPDLSKNTNLSVLDISNNNLMRSSTAALNTLSPSIVGRIPTSIASLTIGNCFSGASTADLSGLTNLTSLNLSTDIKFNRVSGTSPKINSSSIEYYNIVNNAFSTLDSSVINSTSLKDILLDSNALTNGNISFNSATNLTSFSSWYNFHNAVNVSNKTKLITYRAYTPTINGSSTGTNLFTGCTALTSIQYMYSPVTGALPAFSGCTALNYVDLYDTKFSAANVATNNVITDTTFNSCRSTLGFFRVDSPNLSGTFSANAIGKMPSLWFFWLVSQKNANAVSGSFPDFSLAKNLYYIILYNNNLSGPLPSFSNNAVLYYLHVYNNKLTGPVPNIKSSIFSYSVLCYNQLTTFDKLDSTSLYYFDLSFNRISKIPDMSNLTNLRYFYMNNQAVTINSYYSGSFSGMTAMYQLNLANNNMSQGHIDQIIIDLNLNYDKNPRTGVSVNLTGNHAPSGSDTIVSNLKKLRAAGWTIQTA